MEYANSQYVQIGEVMDKKNQSQKDRKFIRDLERESYKQIYREVILKDLIEMNNKLLDKANLRLMLKHFKKKRDTDTDKK